MIREKHQVYYLRLFDMQVSIYFRQIFFALCSCTLLFACSNTEDKSKNQSSKPSEVVSSTTPSNEILKSKSLPILGDSETQSKFKLEDLNAIIENRPRPTSPETLAVLAGNTPSNVDVCNLSYSVLVKSMYEKCFPEGMSYIAMSNIIGWAGEESSRSGNTVVYNWKNGNDGLLTATFINGNLTAKSQNGLK
jgi:hypothetical protein